MLQRSNVVAKSFSLINERDRRRRLAQAIGQDGRLRIRAQFGAP
jgi:hypothetical protein